MNQIEDKATEDVVVGSLIANPKDYNTVAPFIPELSVFTQKKSTSSMG